MKARTYFEACGRRDRCRGLPYRNKSRLLYLPHWAQEAYLYGWTYQQRRQTKGLGIAVHAYPTLRS